MLSGNNWVSKSITVSAINTHTSNKDHNAASEDPITRMVTTENSAVTASIIGYRGEIPVLQEAHLPPRTR